MFFDGHNHTDRGSNIRLIDCINKPIDLIDQALKLGLSGIAITDHEALCSHVIVNKYAKELKEKYPDFTIALGNEIYLTNTRTPQQKYYHFILIAKDQTGYLALKMLSSQAWINSYTYGGLERVPTLKSEVENVMKWAKGHLIATTACIGGELSQLLLENYRRASTNLNNDDVHEKAHEFVNWCIDTFGKDDFYIECAPGCSKDQIIVNRLLYNEIAKPYGLKMIPASDSHYLSKELRFAHKAYLNSKDGEREVDAFYEYSHSMSEAEARENLRQSFDDEEILNWLFKNTEIERKSITWFDLYQTQRIPTVEVNPPEACAWWGCNNDFADDFGKDGCYKTLGSLFTSDEPQERQWINDVWDSLNETIGYWGDHEDYVQRLEIEADVIKYIGDRLNTCLFAYFNTFKHYIDFFWECGSIVGPGRGSATGFLSNYLLGITQLDPIKWNLPWFRFLNKERVELPDIDIDLAPSVRPKIFEKIREERGEYGLLQVITFGTEQTRSAVQTACRGYRQKDEDGIELYPNGIDIDIAKYLSSLIPSDRGFNWPIHDVIYGNEEKGRKPIQTFINEINQYPGLLTIVENIEGIVKNRGIHASGTILYDQDRIFETASIMKSKDGELTTCYDLHDCEYCGDTKYDLLCTEICDKIIECIELLQEDGVIEQDTIRNIYNKYLHPEALDTNKQVIWDHLSAGDVLDVFQFNGGSGLAIAKSLKPQNPIEMTAANAMMRLMSEPGVESQQDRYLRIKNHGLQTFDAEMRSYKLPEKFIQAMHKYCDIYYGCCPIQEQMMQMLMDEDIAGFSLKDANDARKIVAKKQMSRIPELKQKVYDSVGKIYANNGNISDYFWKIAVRPQLGYAFSLNHSLPYTFVGIQSLELASKFNPVYWNTSCLIVNSGSIDPENEGQTKYDKIAKALGSVIEAGIKVSPPDINKSRYQFTPDAQNNTILYGLKALVNVSDDVVLSIINNRPYTSLYDFIAKTKVKKQSALSLIKSGALDHFGDRKQILAQYLWLTCDKKKEINLRNMNGMIQKGLLPQELDFEKKVFEFNRYLKDKCAHDEWYIFDNRALDFVNNYLNEFNALNNGDYIFESVAMYGIGIEIKRWDKIYNRIMDRVRAWMKNNQEEVLYTFNKAIFQEDWNKYAKGTISSWEMATMCYYYHEHELAHINYVKYGLSNFFELPEEPEVIFHKKFKNREVPIFKLYRVCGTVIAKNKNRGDVTLLSPQGVFNVWCNKEFFAMFDKQISVPQPDGTKKVIERSWFSRGSMVIFTGYRRGDEFLPKKYANTKGHLIYHIDEVNGENITIRSERYQGEASEDDE